MIDTSSEAPSAQGQGRKWSRRARWTLPAAIFWCTAMVGAARSDQVLIVLGPMVLMAWAGLYGLCSVFLWVGRLVTHNPKNRPLWNWRATVAASVGGLVGTLGFILSMAFPPPFQISAEAQQGPAFTTTMLAVSGILCAGTFACFVYGIATGFRRVWPRKRAVGAQGSP
jgi:hypothetical protein